MAIGSNKDHHGHVKVIVTAGKNKKLSALPKDRKFTIEDLWAEVQQVRAALEASEQRAAALEIRVQELEAENDRLRKAHCVTEDFLQKKIRKLEKDVSDRDAKIEKLNKQVAWYQKQQFGKKSEKTKPEPTEASEEDAASAKTDQTGNKQNDFRACHGQTFSTSVLPKSPDGLKSRIRIKMANAIASL